VKDNLLKDIKFLTEVERAALAHKDDPPPYGHEELYRSMMWASGTIDVLKSRGYEIKKKEE
jgi:hypothetical protein